MKLYSGSLCIFSHACRFVLKEKDIECDVVYIASKEDEEIIAELNPYGETPTLSDRDLVLYDHTFSNLSGMERECARTVRSSSKASNPTFQPLIGSQEPTPELLVPVIN